MKLPRMIALILVALCVAGFFYFVIQENQNLTLIFTCMGGAILFMVGSVYLKKKEPKEEKSDAPTETAEVDFDPNIMKEEPKQEQQPEQQQQPPTQ